MPTIDPDELAMRCVEDGMTYGVTPHYLIMAAIYLNLDTAPDVTDDAIGNKFRPYMFTQPVWNANCAGGDFNLPFLPADVTDWNMQCSVFAAMARFEQDKLEMNAAGVRPTARALFLVQMNKMGVAVTDDAALTAALDQALTNSRQGILNAAEEILDTKAGPSMSLPDSSAPAAGSKISSASGFNAMDDVAWAKYCNVLGARESSNNYASVNQLNFCGRWQFGAGALTDCGYVKPNKKNSDLPAAASWTGKDGVASLDDWRGNHAAQDQAMALYTKGHYDQLVHGGLLTAGSSLPRVAGLLAAAHLLGVGGATNFANGNDTGQDANGVTAGKYYKLLSLAFGGTGQIEP